MVDRQQLLQRYLENILESRAFAMDPAFWLFIQSEDFVAMIKEFKLGSASQELPSLSTAGRNLPDFDDEVYIGANKYFVVGRPISLFSWDY